MAEETALSRHSVAVMQQAQERLGKLVLASSLGVEDMVLTHLIAQYQLPIALFCIDTGRLPESTLTLLHHSEQRYALAIQLYYPVAEDVEQYVKQHGINGFYNGKQQRLQCCHIRKVKPLARALQGYAGWLTGRRQQQSERRQQLAETEWDEKHQMHKINPLAAWDENSLWDFVHRHDIPYNPLHDQHYPSIGCAPCSRAITVGEPSRAGRWWWEQEGSSECGLHTADKD